MGSVLQSVVVVEEEEEREDERFTWLRPRNVSIARAGAAKANTSRCLRMRFLSRPACIRKETRPNAAGACHRKQEGIRRNQLNAN